MTVTDQDVIKSHNIINNNKNIKKKHFTITHIHTTHNIEPDEKKETCVHLSRFEL